MSGTVILSAEGMDIHFVAPDGELVQVVTELDIHLSPGQSVCVVGRSGSGKTSVLRVMAGLSVPQGGVVRWWGRDVSDMNDDEVRATRRKRMGYVDQGATLVPELSSLENVLLPAFPDGRQSVRALKSRAMDLLAAFGIENRAHSRPPTLSGGERQRVAIARAMLLEPQLLIADEPTASLDSAWAVEMVTLLKEYQTDGHALLLASHDAHVVSACEQTIEIESTRRPINIRRFHD